MPNIACWNIRGVNTPIKQLEVKKLIVDNKLSLLVLNETRVKLFNHSRVLKYICSWKALSNYNSAYKIFVIEELAQGNQFIHCKVKFIETGFFL